MSGTLRARFVRSLDYFVPATGRGSPEDRRRARLAVGMSLLIAPVMAALAITQLIGGNPEGGLGSAAIGIVLALAPFAYRRFGALSIIVHVALGFAWAGLIYIAVSSRGPGINAASVGLAELPLFAVLLTGVRGGSAWVAICSLTGLGLAGLGHSGYLVERVPAETRLWVEHSALLFITLTLYAVGVLYEARRRQALAETTAQHDALAAAERSQLQAENEAQLAHAEKLASIGRVTAAVAHEINNPLSYLGMNLRYLREELTSRDHDPAELERAINDSIDGVSRIAHLVSRLRSYARGEADTGAPTATDVGAAIERAIKLALPSTQGRAGMRSAIPELPPVRGQEAAVVQVFVNLVVNAAQAMANPYAPTNAIDISAHRNGDKVVVEVCDNGAGIPADILPRITEPFFTTKPIGEGTGLGLAVSKSTLRAVGGKLEFESRPGRTVARVVLPVADPADLPPETTSTQLPVLSAGGRLRILIVDDDERVARSLRRVLGSHELTVVGNGAAALAEIERRAGFDLILCDLMMPGMTGMDVFAAIQAIRPDLVRRIVFVTGGAFTDAAREFCDRHAARIVGKPVSVEALDKLLAEAVAQ